VKRIARRAIPRPLVRGAKSAVRRLIGNVFANQGPVTREDFELIRRVIDEVQPAVVIELGTGYGVSGSWIFEHLLARHPNCKFITVDVFERATRQMNDKFGTQATFEAVHGLTVTVEETTSPAREELASYNGPQDVLRKIVDGLRGVPVGVAFIDSRKGTAVPEFEVLAAALAPNGAILCHDVLNGGKGVELQKHLLGSKQFSVRVHATSDAGLLDVRWAPTGESDEA
jgi:predicted O-methyltransferase YrrM